MQRIFVLDRSCVGTKASNYFLTMDSCGLSLFFRVDTNDGTHKFLRIGHSFIVMATVLTYCTNLLLASALREQIAQIAFSRLLTRRILIHAMAIYLESNPESLPN